MITDNNYGYTIDASRNEGGEEEGGENSVFYKESSSDGSTGGKTRSRIIYFENSAKEIKPFVVNNVQTTNELIQEILFRIPINTDVIGLRMSPSRTGTINRLYLDGIIPDTVEDIYICLYLKKHPVG